MAGAVTTGRQNTAGSPRASTASPAVTVSLPRTSRSEARTTTVAAGVRRPGTPLSGLHQRRQASAPAPAQVSFSGAEFSGAQVNFHDAKFSGAQVSFGAVEFSGGQVNFNDAEFSSGQVNFYTAEFSGGQVSFSSGEFSGGEVFFSGAEFSGGQVDFAEAGMWSHPPEFDWDGKPPAGVTLPAAAP